VEAGSRGGFGLVVGVDRGGWGEELRRHGADIVLSDLRDLLSRRSTVPPSALHSLPEIRQGLDDKEPAIFLDYDGTLTPIADRPDLAVLGGPVRETVRDLARLCTVVLVSGRDRADVQRLVGLDALIYAGSHGFDIAGPGGFVMQHPEGNHFAPALAQAAAELQRQLEGVAGVLIEPKRYALAVHYRLAAAEDYPKVEAVVDRVAAAHPRLRKTGGKMLFELRPRLAWDKGKAVLRLLTALGLDRPDVLPFYLGDDLTDEDAFAAIANHGIGILVGEPPGGTTQARYGLDNPDEVRRFLAELIAIQRARSGPAAE
jgi:alpha,alpha-trehalase